MFGKHFASMYEGSMVGAGAVVFAVWGYAISKQRPERVLGSVVTLNPTLIAAALGEGEAAIVTAIEFLCSPDERSHNKAQEGRRLVRLGHFEYQVVSGKHYRAIRSEVERLEYQRKKQAEYRAAKRVRQGKPLKGELLKERMEEIGSSEVQKAAVEAEILESFKG